MDYNSTMYAAVPPPPPPPTYEEHTHVMQTYAAPPGARSGGAPRSTDEYGESIDPAKLKTRLCSNFQAGTCTFGPRCAFAHGQYELRSFDARRGSPVPTGSPISAGPPGGLPPPPSYNEFKSGPTSPRHSPGGSPVTQGPPKFPSALCPTSPSRSTASPLGDAPATPSRYRHEPYSPTKSYVVCDPFPPPPS
jgi:hypothetical protein